MYIKKHRGFAHVSTLDLALKRQNCGKQPAERLMLKQDLKEANHATVSQNLQETIYVRKTYHEMNMDPILGCV